MPSDPTTLLGVPVSWFIQGLIGLIVFFWAWKEARTTYRATASALKPNPVVAGVTMAWDRDQQERFLQLVERIAAAAEAQASHQGSLADQRHSDMKKKIEGLMEALDRKERDLSATVSRYR